MFIGKRLKEVRIAGERAETRIDGKVYLVHNVAANCLAAPPMTGHLITNAPPDNRKWVSENEPSSGLAAHFLSIRTIPWFFTMSLAATTC